MSEQDSKQDSSRNVINIPYKFEPRVYQQQLFTAIDSGYKRAIVAWHRRAGKDKAMWNLIIKKALERVGIYYYLFPEFTQGRRIIWDGIDGNGVAFLDHIPKDLLVQANKTDMKITLANGSIIQIMGTDKVNKLRGANPVGCVFSEFAFQNPIAWDIVRPILGENNGWSLFNSTPNGRNFFYDMFMMAQDNNSWYSQLLTVEDSVGPDGQRYVPQSVIDEDRASGMTEAMIRQEYYCSFEANADGFYYADFLTKARDEGRIGEVPYYPELPVETYWDIGVGDSTAIWFIQTVGRGYHVIDFYENSSKGLDHYVKVCKSKDYIYASHNFPHDMGIVEFGTGRSRIEQAQKLFKGTPLRMVPKLSIEEGVNAARIVLAKTYFDSEKTKEGLRALDNYSRAFNKRTREYSNHPNHNWTSHAADAFRYFAVGVGTPRTPTSRIEQRIKKFRNVTSSSWMTA